MAIQSSALLAQILIAEPDAQIAGARYAREWRRRFAPRLHAATLFAHAAMHHPSRVLAATLVTLFPGVLTLGARMAGKAA